MFITRDSKLAGVKKSNPTKLTALRRRMWQNRSTIERVSYIWVDVIPETRRQCCDLLPDYDAALDNHGIGTSSQPRRGQEMAKDILVIGATRGIWLATVKTALSGGYCVRAFARTAIRIPIDH